MTTGAAVPETESFDPSVIGPAGGDPRNSASVRTMGTGGANRSRWLLRRIEELLGGYSAPNAASASAATDLVSLPGHGLSQNQAIRFYAIPGQSIPSPLVAGTIYFVFFVDADTFKVRATSGGSAIDLTGAGTAFFVVAVVDALAALATVIGGVTSKVKDAIAFLGANNTWSGHQEFEGDVDIQGDFSSVNGTFSAGIQSQGPIIRTGVDASIPDRIGSITNSTTSLDFSFDVYQCAAPVANQTITFVATTGDDDGKKCLVRRPASGNFTFLFKRSDGTNIVTLESAVWATATFEVIAGTVCMVGNAGTVIVGAAA